MNTSTPLSSIAPSPAPDTSDLILNALGGYGMIVILLPIIILAILLTLSVMSLKLTDIANLLEKINDNTLRGSMPEEAYALHLIEQEALATARKKRTQSTTVTLLGVVIGLSVAVVGMLFEDTVRVALYTAGGLTATISLAVPIIEYLRSPRQDKEAKSAEDEKL